MAVPGGFEYDLAAHSAAKKEAWLDQLVRARGDDLIPAPPPTPARPAGGVVRATTGATLPLGAAAGVAPLPAVERRRHRRTRSPRRRTLARRPRRGPGPAGIIGPFGDHVLAPARAPVPPQRPAAQLPTNPFSAPPNPFTSSTTAPDPFLAAADALDPAHARAPTQTSDPFGDHVLAPSRVQRADSNVSSEPADLVEAFAACVVDDDAHEDHCECAVCFDELYKDAGRVVGRRGRRLCRHVVHLDCLKDCLPRR